MAALAFIILCFTARAAAQFQVSSDHLDATPAHVQKEIQHTETVCWTAAAKQPAISVDPGQKQLAKGATLSAQKNISAQARSPLQL